MTTKTKKAKTKKAKTKKADCKECGWEETSSKCVVCRQPICANCAMPSNDPDRGAARIKYNGKTGRLCASVQCTGAANNG